MATYTSFFTDLGKIVKATNDISIESTLNSSINAIGALFDDDATDLAFGAEVITTLENLKATAAFDCRHGIKQSDGKGKHRWWCFFGIIVPVESDWRFDRSNDWQHRGCDCNSNGRRWRDYFHRVHFFAQLACP